jgi:hypothetical protein
MKERGMSVPLRRVLVTGVIAAAVAIPAAAFASGSGSPSGKPSPSAAAGAASKSPPPVSKIPGRASRSAAAAKSAAASGNSVPSFTGPTAVAALASQLGISSSAALHTLQQVVALSGRDGLNPTDPAFVAIAHGLGVSPAHLAAALAGVKQALAGK